MPTETVLLVAFAGFAAGLAVAALAARRPAAGVAEAPAPARAPVNGQDNGNGLAADALELLETGVVRVDANFRVVELNSAAAQMLRTDERGLRNRSVMEAFVDHRVEEAARSAVVQGSATVEIAVRDDDERRIAISIRHMPAGGLWLLLDDVTELRRLQRMRSEFIDNLSHELRTPLTTIRLLTETLRQDMERTDLPPRVRERIEKIDVETGHLVQMVNELLDLSRIEGGAAELHFDIVDMRAVIDGALDRLRTFADRQGVRLVTEMAADDGSVRVWGDEERLSQVLVNLLHNAVKFSPERTTVTVSTRSLDGQLGVEVRDEGVGIPRVEIDRVFERFYKVDKARVRGRGGTGLGLAIARHIVEGHGGRIWVDSEEGAGSKFTFTVPRATSG